MRFETVLMACVVLAALVAVGCGDDDAGAGGAAPGPDTSARLTVASPAEGQIFTNLMVPVEGTARDVTKVLVNGTDVEVIDGAFSTTLTQAEGQRSITIEAPGVGETIVRNIAVDINPPELTITSPEHGQFRKPEDGDQIRVQGRAVDTGAGLDVVEVNGVPIAVQGDGSFSAMIPLNVGGNILEIVAKDKANRSVSGLRGAVYGDYVPWGEPMGDAINGRIQPEALDVVEEGLARFIENGIIEQLIETYLPQGEGEDIRLDNLAYEGIKFDMTLQDGHIDFVASWDSIDLAVSYLGTENPLAGSLNIGFTEIRGEIVVDIQNGVPVAEQRNVELTLGVVDLSGEGWIDIVFSLLEDFANALAEDALVDLVADFVLPQLFSPDILRQSFVIFGEPLVIDILLQELTVEATGISMVGNVEMPVGPALGIPDSPGVLTTPGQPPMGEPARMVRMATSDDFANKLVFTAWRAGLLNLEVRELLGEGGQLPALLDVGSISLLVGPEIKEIADSDTPINVELRPLLPPVVSLQDDSTHPLHLTLPDMMVDLSIAPDGEAPTRWATVVLAMEADVTARLVDGQLDLNIEIDVRAELIDEPLFDLDNQKVESTLAGLFESLPSILGPRGLNALFDLTSFELLGIQLGDGMVSASGSSNNYLSIEADITVGDDTMDEGME